ncbi:hypothetical protein AB0A81_38750 [Streptomyces flaveolus]|uniref:Uncharacterized protein n=1 Tax=Streptomyces flaveolus TaxID=67297 RepID=A0ABV1VB63_9ACTN
MTMPNADLAARIRTHIAEYPEHHDQEAWLSGADVLHPEDDLNSPDHCGTTLCVAGYAVHLTGHTLLTGGAVHVRGTDKWHTTEQVARDELGLSDDDATWLFDRRRTRAEVLRALSQLADGAPSLDTHTHD